MTLVSCFVVLRRSRLHPVVGLLAAVLGVGSFPALLIVRVIRAERDALKPPRWERRTRDHPAIAVFGAETLPSGPSQELISRLAHARQLLDAGVGEVIVVSGGAAGALDEVADMVWWLTEHGVPIESIQTGRPGANTRQTATTLARLTRTYGFRPWIAVSTPFHSRRIRDEARRVGIDVVVSGPADSPEMRDPALRRARVVTEAAATAFYLLPECVTSRVRTSAGSWRHSVPLRLAGRSR